MFDPHSVRGLRLCALLGLVSLCATAAAADDSGARAPVVVWMVKGDVHASSGARNIPLKAGTALDLPVSIRVGADGALEMHQGATVVSAAANSQLQIPKATSSDQTLDRIVQSEGNVYYNVAKRPAHKLRVETPLLVAVIKGTRFNVSAVDTMTTISLLEGAIEVHASDDASVVDLSAGQMATRSRSQPAIRVIRMTTGEVIHGLTPAVAAASVAAGQRVDSGLQGLSRSKGEVNRPAALVASNPAAAAVQASALATGVASGQGDDHGASSSLTLNQLVTHASSSSSATNVGGSSGGTGPTVDTGSSSSGLGASTGASGSNGGSLGASTGASGSNGGSLGANTGAIGSNGGSLGANTGTSGSGGTGLGAGAGASSTTTGGSVGTNGSPAGVASGTGSGSTSGATNGNGGTPFSPGNSGITVTPGSGPGSSSASNSTPGGSSANGNSSGQGGSSNSNGQGSGNSNGQGGSSNSNGQGGSSNSNGQGSGNSNGQGGSSNSNGQGSGNSNGQGSNSSNGQSPGNLNAALQSLLNKKKK